MIVHSGQLSEEAAEANNKLIRNIRREHTRKNSRLNTMSDLFHLLMVASDPLISSMRKPLTKKQPRLLTEEVSKLLKRTAEVGDREIITDDEEVEEDSDEQFFNFVYNEDLYNEA